MYNVSDLFLQIFDFSLTEEEMKGIEALNKNIRFVELLMYEYKDDKNELWIQT